MKRTPYAKRSSVRTNPLMAGRRRSCLERLEDRAMLAAPELVSVSPAPNSSAPVDASPVIELDQPVTTETASTGVAMFGSQRADVLTGATINTDGNRIVIDPAHRFFAGERVQVSATGRLRNMAGEALATPYVWEFSTATSPSPGRFSALSDLTPLGTYYSRMGDLNGDGHLDVILVQALPLDSFLMNVYLNDGFGGLSHNQQVNTYGGRQFELGDLDGDGDLDIFSAAQRYQDFGGLTNWIWLNDGLGSFTLGEHFGHAYFFDIALGDIDADGDLDTFATGLGVGAGNVNAHTLWLNNGTANFTASGQLFGQYYDANAEFGDLDGDGDLDLMLSSYDSSRDRHGTRVWMNDGGGQFTDSGQMLGSLPISSISLGDVDGDGDSDALFSVWDQGATGFDPTELYLNNGLGRFSRSPEQFEPTNSRSAILADVDGDGDLDAVVTGYYEVPTRLWRNDGAGHFTSDPDALPSFERVRHASAGDLDGDNDVDLFFAAPTPVLINKDAEADVSLSISDGKTTVRVGDAVTYELTVGNAGPALVEGVSISQLVSDNLLDVSWTSAASNGASAAPNGMGPVSDTPSLPAGSSITYTVTARVGDSPIRSVATSASLALPGRYDDPTRQDHVVNDVNAFATDYEFGGSHFSTGEKLVDVYGEFIANDIDRDGDLDFLVAEGNQFIVERNDGALDFVEILNEYNIYSEHLDVGDVDQDGDVDAIVSNGLWLNDGDGSFAPSPRVVMTASAALFADLNGDGWLDVYAGGRPGQGASIWLNDGSGELWEQAQRYDAQFISSLETGDLDGDGDLDLVAVFQPYQQNSYTLLLVNNGTGVMQYGRSIGQEMYLDAKVGDLDGDGDLDIVSGSGPRMVWLNDGDGNFAWNGQSFPFPEHSGQAAVADFDGDADLDVYLARRTFRNDGSGNFEIVREFASSQLDRDSFVQAVDYDLDGDADLVTAFNGISIFRNFEGVSDLAVTIGETTPAVVPGDEINAILRVENVGTELMRAVVRLPLDVGMSGMAWTSQPSQGATSTPAGVGAIEDQISVPAGGSIEYTVVATTDPQLVGSLTLLATVGVGEESPQRYADPSSFNNLDSDTATVQLTPVTRPGGQFTDTEQRLGEDGMPAVALGDLDGDGDLDALAIETNHGTRVWRNDGNGRFTAGGDFFGSSRAVMARIADLDGDDDLDALLVGLGNANTVWINDGNGLFSQREVELPGAQSIAVALGDLDGDGDVDAYVVNTDGQPDHVYWNDGHGNFVDSGLRLGAESGLTAQLGDVDGDGDLDAIVANVAARNVEVWKNNGAGGFTRDSVGVSNEVAGRLAIGDLDNDGDLDFVIPDRAGIAIAYNQGRGNFFSMARSIPGQQQAVALADLDGNGLLDIYVAKGGPVAGEPDTIFINQGGGSFDHDPQALGNSAGVDVALADLDGDGDTDAFVANGRSHTGESSEVWLNGQRPGDTYPFDGVVDLSDLNRVRNNFGATGIVVEGDANGDGVVDLTDLNLVRNHFGTGPAPNSLVSQSGQFTKPTSRKSLAAIDALFYQLVAQDGQRSTRRRLLRGAP